MTDNPIEFAMRFDRVGFLHDDLVGEFDAAFRAATGEDVAASRGGHSSAETGFVCVFFRGRLISFLSHNEVLLCF